MVHAAKMGHPGGDLSAADILATLYFRVLSVNPANPSDPARDRFILSKGHASAVLYATLAEKGFFPAEWLTTYMQPLSALNGHPDRNKVPGVEANTGPLGHGLPIAVGAALGGKMDGATFRTFVLTGDGELQEGSNWEAAMAASQFRLDRLTVIVDRNGLQQGDRTEHTMGLEPLADRWRAFGWEVAEVDGHDVRGARRRRSSAYRSRPAGRRASSLAPTRGVACRSSRIAWNGIIACRRTPSSSWPSRSSPGSAHDGGA